MYTSSQKTAINMDNWIRNVCHVAEISRNNEVKEVLHSIINLDSGQDEYYFLVCQKMNSIACLKLEQEELKVTDLISDITKLTFDNVNYLFCLKFAKINFKIFHNNVESARCSVYLENYIRTVCSLIANCFEAVNQSECMKLAKIQLSIIIELESIYNDSFMGNKYIINLFIKLINVDICELGEHFTNILNHQVKHPSFCQDIFSIELNTSYADFLRYCFMILQLINSQDLSVNMITSDKESSFPCKLITSLSRNLDAMETNTEIYDYVINDITDLVVKSSIQGLNFKIIEQQLIEGIIGDDYGSSVVCFNIMCEYLLRIESDDTLKSYFVLFQDLLLLMWSPCLPFIENRQVYVATILKILYKMHHHILNNSIVTNLKPFFNQNNHVPHEFQEVFSKLKSSPTVENYYKLVNAQYSNQIDEKQSKDILNLIELAGNSDFTVYSSIVLKVIGLIADTKDPQKKMMYLLKFNPLDSLKEFGDKVPLEIAHKLLEMILTFMPKASGCDGLRSYIKKLLDMLLDRDISVRRLYLNLRIGKTLMMKEEDTRICNAEDILKNSNSVNVHHVCIEKLPIVWKNESSQLNNLEKMLVYSKYLANRKLSNREYEIVTEIILNLQKIRLN